MRGLRPGGVLLLVTPTTAGCDRVAERLRNAMIGVKRVKGIHDDRYAELTKGIVQVVRVDPEAADLDRALRQLGRTRTEVHLMAAAPRRDRDASEDKETPVTYNPLAHPVFKRADEPASKTEEAAAMNDIADKVRQTAVNEDAVKRMLASGIIG